MPSEVSCFWCGTGRRSNGLLQGHSRQLTADSRKFQAERFGGSVNFLFRRFAVILLGGAVTATLPSLMKAQFQPAPGTGPGLPEAVEAIERARGITRILYV